MLAIQREKGDTVSPVAEIEDFKQQLATSEPIDRTGEEDNGSDRSPGRSVAPRANDSPLDSDKEERNYVERIGFGRRG